tara:strand:- start:4078 stop:5385 length:1308 start_codon:yes stop_codon:yes gene_type:complete
MKKTYVLDTSAILSDSNVLYSYGRNDIVIPLKVLEEIDNHKKRQDGVGVNARSIIRALDSFREKGSLHSGVRIARGKGILLIRGFDASDLPEDLDRKDPDNQIIGTALTIKRQTAPRKVFVVSRDINMRVKCDALEIPSQDIAVQQVVRDTRELYMGLAKHLVDDQIIDQFYNGEDIFIEEDDVSLYPNQFVMLVSNQNEKKSALAKFLEYSRPLSKVADYHQGVWGLKPRNKEQQFALDVLMNPDISVVTIIGRAGSGKTLLAIAAGLEQVVEKNIYSKVVISRPVQPMGKDIGFLPGTLEEKMKPWLMPIHDNLEFLMDGNKSNIEHLYERGSIDVEALTYIRGRSIANAFIIVDEAQNLSQHELKTIITRAGEGAKIILTGDIEQIDNVYLDATSNGLSYAIEKLKPYNLTGHVTLTKGERSKIATLAAKVL